MPSRRDKLAAHVPYLVDGYLRLRATYAILEPLLSDQSLRARCGSGAAEDGRRILVGALLHACVLRVANLTRDRDERTPSLDKLRRGLEEPLLYNELREGYAVWNVHPEPSHPDVLKMIAEIDDAERERRRVQFDALVEQFRSDWDELQRSPALRGCETLRDKVVAHREVRFQDGRYEGFDGTGLLQLDDLRTVVLGLEQFVNYATWIYLSASFAFADYDQRLRDASAQFWAVARDG